MIAPKAEHVRSVVTDYVNNNFDFETMRIESIELLQQSSDESEFQYRVKLTLALSPDAINQLVADGIAKEKEVRRMFLEHDFKLTLTVQGNVVTETNWEDIQFS